MDCVSPIAFSNNNLTIGMNSHDEIMSPVEAIGDKMIKRFAVAIEANEKKINKGRLASATKAPLYEEDSGTSSDQDLGGLREDYKLLLETRKGFPWNEISLIKKPHLQELLISLHLLEKCEKNTLEFALVVANSTFHNIANILGELLFIADRYPKLDISINHLPESVLWIKEKFSDEQNKVLDKLYKHYASHKLTCVQSPEIALMTQLSFELAQLLLTEKGAVNFGIIPSLLHNFIDEPLNPNNYEINIVYTFKQLLDSPVIREKIAKISRPESILSPSNIVIRSVLDLPANIALTDLHAQQTALSGLLSHVRQGVDGSCFATPLVMGLLSSHLELCLDDFSSLLTKGRLSRKIHLTLKEFPYLLRMNNKSLNVKIELKKDGEIVQKNKPQAYIWEIPGFIKACEAIGLKDYEFVFKKIIAHFFEKDRSHEIKTVTIRNVLQELANFQSSRTLNTKTELGLIFATVYFAFEGQICNPLLGVWENSIAGMAEGEEGSLVTSSIINTSMKVIKEKLKELAPHDLETRKKIKNTIKEILRDRIQLHYDPIIHHSTPSKDQHTTEGAFVLYDKGDYERTSSWTRVDNPHEFSAFISRIIEKAKHKISEDAKFSEKELFEKLLSYTGTEEFLESVISQYFNKNPKVTRTLSQYKKMKYTPWITKSGNNFSKVIQVYFESPQNLHSTLMRPHDQKDLFLKMGNFSRSLDSKAKEEYSKNPYKSISARIPGVHAFSLIIGHPTFFRAWSNDLDLEKWLTEQVMIPGQTIANSIIDDEQRKKLVEFTFEHLVAFDHEEIFKAELMRLPKKMKICEFRHSIMKLADLAGKHLQLFDSYLYHSLPEEHKRILDRSAVHFADTNWSDNMNDLHFCFVVNPGSGNFEIWAAHDDHSGMQALDQPLWLQEWEVFTYERPSI